MTEPNFIILYVDNPTISATFYSELLEQAPIEAAPTFAMFALKTGLRLGLWSRHTVEPAASALAGSCELVFEVADNNAVQHLYNDWKARGLSLLQEPTDMDFGRTFVALDPDHHRLRVYAKARS